MIEVGGFLPKHFDNFDFKACYFGDEEMVEQMKARYNQPNVCIVTMIADKPIAILACQKLWEGVGDVFGFVGKECSLYPLEFAKICKNLVSTMIAYFELHRIQMTVKEGYPQNTKFAEFLGFEKEGVLRNYGINGENYYMYARVE